MKLRHLFGDEACAPCRNVRASRGSWRSHGDVRVDFVASEALAAIRSATRRSGRWPSICRRRYDPAGLAALSGALRAARLHRRRRRADLDASVGDQRVAVGRPADRAERACRPRSSCSSTASRAWAARSTSTRSTTGATRPTSCATSSATSTRTTARSRPRAAARCSESRRAVSARCTRAWNIPGVFAAFASHSGDSYFRYAHLPAFATRAPHARGARLRHRRVRRSVRGQAQAQLRRVHDDGDARLRRGVLAARARPPSTSICPSTRSTGELREEVFARWLAFDPAERVGEQRAELARLRLRYLDCGRRDEYNLDIGARVVSRAHRATRARGASRGIRRRSSQRRLPVRNLASGARRRFGSENDETLLLVYRALLALHAGLGVRARADCRAARRRRPIRTPTPIRR